MTATGAPCGQSWKRARRLCAAALLAVVLGACAGRAASSGAEGAPPVETRHSALARAHLAETPGAEPYVAEHHFGGALEAARAGIAARPANPLHHLLAGVAHAGLGQAQEADSLWRQAEEMWPAYGAEIALLREQAWAQAFARGTAAHQEGRREEAIAEWQSANLLFPLRPEAFFNLGALHAQAGEIEAALAMYRRAIAAVEAPPSRELGEEERADRRRSRRAAYEALGQLLVFADRYVEAEEVYRALLEEEGGGVEARTQLAVILTRQGRAAEAAAIYDELASAQLRYRDHLHIGLGLFHGGQFWRAAESFGRAAQLNPHSRDALHNQVLALYAETRWLDLIEPAQRLLQVDPLNESVALILAHALRETLSHRRALEVLQQLEEQPVHLGNLQLRPDGERLSLTGEVVGNAAPAGSTVRLRFIFLGAGGEEVDQQLLTLTVPAPGHSVPFVLPLTTGVEPLGYRYQLAP